MSTQDPFNDQSSPAAEYPGERLAKYLAAAGIASRRNCEQLITEGHVTVNGKAVTSPAFNVRPGEDEVCFNGKPIRNREGERVYIMLNKPAGYTCSAKDVHAKELVYQLIPPRFGRVFTIGRLDRDSEGLLILTNDGDYAQRLMHPSERVLKRYLVECEGQFSTSIRRKMLDGMYDNGEFLHAVDVQEKSVQRGHCVLIITLGDGRKREVRRMCKDVGLKVLRLQRVAVGMLELDSSLALGGWRQLTPAELEMATKSPAAPRRAMPDPAQAKPYWQLKEHHTPRALRLEREKERDEAQENQRPSRPAPQRSKPAEPRPQRPKQPWYADPVEENTQEESAPAPRRRSYQRDEREERAPAPRRRNYQRDEREERAPAPRRRSYQRDEREESAPAPRRRNYQRDEREESAPAPRRRNYQRDERDESAPAPRRRVSRDDYREQPGRSSQGGGNTRIKRSGGRSSYPRDWR